MADFKNSFNEIELAGKSNCVQVKALIECLNCVKVLMREMAMYYYACKLSSVASCSSRKNDGRSCCGNVGSSASNPMPSTSSAAAPSTSKTGCSCCTRYKHKSKHKVNCVSFLLFLFFFNEFYIYSWLIKYLFISA